MDYTQLQPEDRLTMLRSRIAAAERDHYANRLDADAQRAAGQDPPPAQAQVDALDKRLGELHKEEAALEREVAAKRGK